jgi:hypothetical protein
MVWVGADGRRRSRELDKEPHDLHPELFPPCRRGTNYQHRRNYEGMYPFSRTGQFLWYESFTEFRSLVLLEHTERIAAISTQPFCLVFTDGTRCYPDFYAVHDNQARSTVYEVKALDLIDAKVNERFRKTADVCEAMGWEFAVLHGIEGFGWKNLELLAYNRLEDMHPATADQDRLMGYLQQPHTIAESAMFLDPAHPAWRLPGIYHLMFKQAIAYDHDGPITLKTKIWTGTNHAACTTPR